MHAVATVSRPSLGIYWEPVAYPAATAVFLAESLYLWVAGARAVFIVLAAVTTALMSVSSILALWRYIHSGVTVSASDHAVVLNGRELAFSSIDSIAFQERPRVSARDKRTIAFIRWLAIVAEGQTYRFKWWGLKDDPVTPIVQQLLQRMEDETQRRTLEGDGWSVDHADLFTDHGATPLATLSAAGIYDDQVRLWRDSESEAFIGVPKTSPNALVLLRVANGRAGPAPDSGTLGRLLFTRKPSGVVNILMALLTGAVVLLCAFAVIERWAPHFLEELDLGCGILTLILLIRAFLSFGTRYRFYERGVVATSIGGRSETLYADVQRVTWRERRMNWLGAYLGTRVYARLYPAAGPPLRISLYRRRFSDPDMDWVRKRAARR